MAINKNILMKQFNGTDYDILYPKTIAEQVEGVYSKSESSKAVRGTYPAYNKIAAGDVVDVVNGMVRHEVKDVPNELTVLCNPYAKVCMLDAETGVAAYVASNKCYLVLFRVSVESAVPVSVVSQTELDNFAYLGTNQLSLAALSSTKFVLAGAVSNGSYSACICTVNSDNTITAWAAADICGGASSHVNDRLQLVFLKENFVLAVFGLYNYENLRVQNLTISGTAITPGAVQQMPVNADIGKNNILALSACLVYADSGGARVFIAAYNSAAKLFCVTVDVIFYNEAVAFSLPVLLEYNTTKLTPVCCTNGTFAVVAYNQSNKIYAFGCHIHSINGDIAASAKTALLEDDSISAFSLLTFGTEFFAFFTDSNSIVGASLISVSGTDLSVSAGPLIDSGAVMAVPDFCVQLDSSHILICGMHSQYKATTLEFRNYQLAGRWVPLSTQAIALNGADVNENCTVLFSGTVEVSGLTVGTNITSDGVQGYVPQDGVLSAFPWWDYRRVSTVTGTYTGDDAETQTIDLGFQPRAVISTDSSGMTCYGGGSYPRVYGGLTLPGKPLKTGGTTAIEITGSGFAVHKIGSYTNANENGTAYRFIAFR